MDIAGAKALKDRLGSNAKDEPSVVPFGVPADAPPVYHWVGVGKMPSDRPVDAEDASAGDSASLFSRLGLSFR